MLVLNHFHGLRGRHIFIVLDSNEVGHQSLLAIHHDSRHGCHYWDDDDEEDSDPESSVGPSLTINANTIIEHLVVSVIIVFCICKVVLILIFGR